MQTWHADLTRLEVQCGTLRVRKFSEQKHKILTGRGSGQFRIKRVDQYPQALAVAVARAVHDGMLRMQAGNVWSYFRGGANT